MDTKHLPNIGLIIIFAFSLATQSGCNLFNPAKMHTAKYNYMILRLSSDRSVAQIGEPVNVRFTITNEGGDTWIASPNTPVMDIVASSMDSAEILLTWSSKNPDKVSHRLEWKPGESKMIELTWIPKQGDVYIGYRRDIHFSGVLNSDSKLI